MSNKPISLQTSHMGRQDRLIRGPRQPDDIYDRHRVLKEYGVSASTPESVERLPLPARPVPRQTAFALRIMSRLLVTLCYELS